MDKHMKMKLSTPILIAIYFFFSFSAEVFASSADFKLTVKIPAIVGVNIFPASQLNNQESEKALPIRTQATIEKIFRDGEKIKMQTFTVK